MKRIEIATCLLGLMGSTCVADEFDLRTGWSETSNPSGPWTIREGTNPLPHVADWRLAPWSTPQPGWARSENTNTALPFFFKSNGTELFPHDWAAGQIIFHSTDGANGVGSGPANVLFTVPRTGRLSIRGGTWIGRDIGRAVVWTIFLNGVALSSGTLSSGDVYSGATPFEFTAGSGGLTAVSDIVVTENDHLVVWFDTTSSSSFGDFVGIEATVTIEKCPADYSGTEEVDVLDFLDFIDDFSACDGQVEPCGTYGNPDINGDTIIDILDFLDFLDAFGQGC